MRLKSFDYYLILLVPNLVWKMPKILLLLNNWNIKRLERFLLIFTFGMETTEISGIILMLPVPLSNSNWHLINRHGVYSCSMAYEIRWRCFKCKKKSRFSLAFKFNKSQEYFCERLQKFFTLFFCLWKCNSWHFTLCTACAACTRQWVTLGQLTEYFWAFGLTWFQMLFETYFW